MECLAHQVHEALRRKEVLSEGKKWSMRRFQFSLKTLIVASVMMFLGVALVTVRIENNRLQEEVESLTHELSKSEHLNRSLRLEHFGAASAGVYVVTIDGRWTGGHEGFKILGECESLLSLILDGSIVTDEDLIHIRDLKYLQILQLNDTGVTDACIEHIRDVKSLRVIQVRNTRMTSAGIEALRRALPQATIQAD